MGNIKTKENIRKSIVIKYVTVKVRYQIMVETELFSQNKS